MAIGLGLAASALVLVPAPGNAAGQALVINEVYGGADVQNGGVLNRDFVELFNTGGTPVSLSGMSLQHRGSLITGLPAPNAVFALPDVEIPGGGSYLVAGKAGTAGTALPEPDATWGLDIGDNSGQVFLANTTAPLDPNVPAGSSGSAFNTDVVDFVGWGANTTSYEGSAPAVGTGGTTSVTRGALGADTDDNEFDLARTTTPSPTACGCVPEPPDTLDATIAEVQGSGTSSPHLNDIVTTEGVATAVYKNGGLDGFFLQNGDTAGASDGIFVAGSKLTKDDYPGKGDSVRVTGTVKEVGGTTQITGVGAAAIVDLPAALPAPTAAALPWNSLSAAEREDHEGELVAPQGAYTVTDVSQLHSEAMIGLTPGGSPLEQPTETEAPGTAAQAKAADNAARTILLDDGATTNYAPSKLNDTAQSKPTPWLTALDSVRVGDGATFANPLVLDQREGTWRLQPTERVNGARTDIASFDDAGDDPAQPRNVAGDIRMATFDVGGYYTTLGEKFDPTGAKKCEFTVDKEGVKNAVVSCDADVYPRGAANAAGLTRQKQKLVVAINSLGAGIVALQDVENTARFGGDSDAAVNSLVSALNADAGAGTWASVAWSAAAPATEGVVRTALIYRPDEVRAVGDPQLLSTTTSFAGAARPLAQAFTAANGLKKDSFTVVANQFTERGAGELGAGPANDARVSQAQALTGAATNFANARGTSAVFLLGNFNAYAKEQPIQVLESAGYQRVATPGQSTYSAAGGSGNLDHVLANTAAMAMRTGADVWGINAAESEAYGYRRHDANATLLFDQGSPMASSDHNPLVVGLDLSEDERFGSTVTATDPTASLRAGSGTANVEVEVGPAAGSTPSGTVAAYLAGKQVGKAVTLAGDGTASLPIGPFDTAGTKTVQVRYAGDDNFAKSQDDVTVSVSKARSTMTAKAPGKVIVKKTKAKLATTVKATGLVPTGKVTAKLGSKTIGSGTLRSGKVTLTLAKFKKTGSFKVKVSYAGSADVGTVSKTVTVKVKR
jgi:predicted extracellular nuclease